MACSKAAIKDLRTAVTRCGVLLIRAAFASAPAQKVSFSPDYRDVSPNNRNGQMVKSFSLFTHDSMPETLFNEGDTVLAGHSRGDRRVAWVK